MYAVGMLTLVFFIFHTFVISGKLTLNLNWNIMGCRVVFFNLNQCAFIVWALGGSFSVIVHIWLHVSCKDFSLTINLTNYWKDIWYLELDNWWYTHKVFTYQFQTWDKKNQIFSQFNIYPVFKIKNQQAFIKCILQQFTYFSDQNRNKTKTKNNQKSANQQADVISLHSKQEVTRLEALCETRTKELNYARLQMKSNLQAFDAMTVMVQYLSEDVGTTV